MRRAGAELALIPRTEGEDIRHLMRALEHLHALYRFKVYLLLGLLGLVLLLVLAHPAA
jgi:hypothetical protein